jgi:hypothetical protein
MYTAFRKKERKFRNIVPRFFDASVEFAAFCVEYLDYIRMIELPNILSDNVCDTVVEKSRKEAGIACQQSIGTENNEIETNQPDTKITNEIKKTISRLEENGQHTPVIIKEILSKRGLAEGIVEEPTEHLLEIVHNIESREPGQTPPKKQAILVCFESSPHVEFVIRNIIIKLESSWYHSIICGPHNYEYMEQIAIGISNKISVLKLENCENTQQHNQFMKTVEYWEMFSADKLLHYTPTTTIFKRNIDEFMQYDYISASSYHQLGTGSLSLRTRQTMIDILTNFENMASGQSETPEDMFFSKLMVERDIGNLADKPASLRFSTEHVNTVGSMGGHNYWAMNVAWKTRVFESVIIQCKPCHNADCLQFRGGWKSVLYRMKDLKFFEENSKIHFFDILEQHFTPSKTMTCENKWAGIIHLTPNGPPYLNSENIALLFSNQHFLKSLDSCFAFFTLSPYITKYMQGEFEKIQRPINVITLKHPVVQEDIIPFSFEKFQNNSEKILIQIGQQYRKMTSIYHVSVPENYSKMWLTGTKLFERLNQIMKLEQKHIKKSITPYMRNTVKMYYTQTYEEYDEYLSKNIVFIDLFDAAANNTVLECIVRKTPIIVNKIPGVIDYLGEDYPLYFSDLEDVPALLSEEKLLEAHEYLKKMDCADVEIDYFIKKLMTAMHYAF